MTGQLLFNRQLSSTGGKSNVDKTTRTKLRRCSSADHHQHVMEPIPDDPQHKKKLLNKSFRLSTDVDSGTEDLDQQAVDNVGSHTDDDDDDKGSTDFCACGDEGYEGNELPAPVDVETTEDHNVQNIRLMQQDLNLAASIPDDEKKYFCPDTTHVFHAEFQRLIASPISFNSPGIRYHLYADGELDGDPCYRPGFSFISVDNAKGQFKCPNCARSWTSMRARIAFKISRPQPDGFIVLKICGQECQSCGAPADALWYMEEVCRVMRNLAATIFSKFFPWLYDLSQCQQAVPEFNRAPGRPHHDPKQRKGKMTASHSKEHCEACKYGWCFPSNL